MNVSMHLHDCKTNEKRCASASMVAEFERKHGPIKTAPIQQREVETRVDLVIRADVADKENRPECIKRRRGRPKGSSTSVPAAMIHDIKARMEKSGVRQKQVADADETGIR
jgi:hypothetical protein